MSLTPAQLEATRTTKAAILSRLSLPADESSWTYDERAAYLEAFAAIIQAAPDRFGAAQRAVADKLAASGMPGLEDYTLAEKVGDFFAEVGEQAEAINPLSERNRGTAGNMLFLAVLVGVGIYAAVLAQAHQSALRR